MHNELKVQLFRVKLYCGVDIIDDIAHLNRRHSDSLLTMAPAATIFLAQIVAVGSAPSYAAVGLNPARDTWRKSS